MRFELAGVGHLAALAVLDDLASTARQQQHLASEAFASCAAASPDRSVRAAVALTAPTVTAARQTRRVDDRIVLAHASRSNRTSSSRSPPRSRTANTSRSGSASLVTQAAGVQALLAEARAVLSCGSRRPARPSAHLSTRSDRLDRAQDAHPFDDDRVGAANATSCPLRSSRWPSRSPQSSLATS